MDVRTRRLAHVVLFVVGLVLIVGGIATRKYGAAIIGLVVAAVNVQQWQQWNKRRASRAQGPQGA